MPCFIDSIQTGTTLALEPDDLFFTVPWDGRYDT
jgi:hypothetical protein